MGVDRVDRAVETGRPATAPIQMVMLATPNEGVDTRAARREAVSSEDAALESNEEPVQVDIQAVADMVYRLMQRDLMLGRERMGRYGG